VPEATSTLSSTGPILDLGHNLGALGDTLNVTVAAVSSELAPVLAPLQIIDDTSGNPISPGHDAVASAGTIAFPAVATVESTINDLIAGGRHTDYGLALQSSSEKAGDTHPSINPVSTAVTDIASKATGEPEESHSSPDHHSSDGPLPELIQPIAGETTSLEQIGIHIQHGLI
jgi:hypothetical protein